MPTENVTEPILRMYTDPQSSSAPQPSSVPQPGPASTHPGPIRPEPMSSRPSHLKPLSTKDSGQDYNPPGRGQTVLLMAGIYIRAIYEVYVFALFCVVISLCLVGDWFRVPAVHTELDEVQCGGRAQYRTPSRRG